MIGKQFIDLFFRVETKEAQKDIDNIGQGLDNVGKKGGIAQKGLTLLGNGFKFVGGAIKAAGIGLLVGLLAQLTGIFQSNQKVADTFGRIMLKLKPVFDVLGDVIGFVASVLEGLIDLFTGAINWLGSLIGLSDGYASSTADLADEIVNLRNEQKLMNAELALTQLQYQREAELQRQIRDDTSKTMEERIAANEELGRILEQQAEEERQMALVALDLAEKELSLERDNIDLQVAVIEAKTKLAEIDERITGQRSEQLVNLTSLEKERADKQKEYSERIQKELEEEQKAYDDILKKMRQHIEVAEEELTLTEKLEAAEKAFIEAKEHLATLKETDTTANKKAIQDSKDLIAQKKLESQAIQEEINNMKAQDDALAEFEDAHEEQKAAVLAIYDEMYKGLTKTGQEYFDDLRLRQGVENAENLEDLKLATGEIEFIYKELNAAKGKLSEESRFTEEELAEDLQALKKYRGEFNTYYDSLEDQTKHRFDNEIKQNQKELEEKKRLINEEIKQIEEQNKIIIDKDKELEKKIEEATIAFNDAQKELKAQNLEAVLEFMKTEQQKEIDAVEDKYDAIIAKTIEGSDHEKQLTDEKNKAIQEINDRYYNEARQKGIDFLQKQFDIIKAFNKKQEEEEKARKELALESALSVMDSLLSISKTQADKEIKQLDLKLKKGLITEEQYDKKLLQIEREQLRKEKKAALLQIGVDTASGISSAVKAGAGIPFPANLAAIGAGIAAVLAGVAQATSVLGQSVEGIDNVTSDIGGDGGDGDLSGDVPGLPTFGAIETDAPPIQAFVVESDVSNAQALQTELNLQSTL